MNGLIVNQTPAHITANFDEVKAGLTNMMQAYESLEVTEENIPERKKDVATLRKIRKAVDDKRKAVKKEYDKPLKEFEKKCKELTDVIDTEIAHIADGLKVYEEKRIQQKRAVIETLYINNVGDCGEYIPLNAIYDTKWENKSCSEKEIVSDIQEAVLKVKSDLLVINNTCGEYAVDCIQVYKRGRDLQMALQRYNDLRTARERAEQDLRRANAEPEQIPAQDVKTPQNGEKLAYTWEFTVFSEDDANSIKAYMEMFGIRYEVRA